MQQREKILLISFIAALVLWQGKPVVERTLFGPIQERRIELAAIQGAVAEKEEREIEILRSSAKLENWKGRSLPPDALDALRLYQQWLTDVAQIAGFSELQVKPERNIPRGSTYVAVQVSVEGQARLEQLASFLYHFHAADLLHRVSRLTIESDQSEGDPLLEVSLVAEGLSLQDAPRRERLFPQAALAAQVSSTATRLAVTGGEGFPAEGEFRIRIGSEYLTVTGVSGSTWTVRRGADATNAAGYPEGELVELAPVGPSRQDRTLEDYRTLVAASPFVKPAGQAPPPRESTPRPVLARISRQTVYPGETVTFTARLTGNDPEQDKLRFRLDGAPAGATIDADTGEFRWTPDLSLEPRDYSFTVVASNNGSPSQTASERVTVTVRDDGAQETYLVGFFAQDEDRQAMFYDRSNDQRMLVREGTTFSFANFTARVLSIGHDFVVVQRADDSWRLDVGQNLRSMVKLSPPPADDAGASAAEPDEN